MLLNIPKHTKRNHPATNSSTEVKQVWVRVEFITVALSHHSIGLLHFWPRAAALSLSTSCITMNHNPGLKEILQDCRNAGMRMGAEERLHLSLPAPQLTSQLYHAFFPSNQSTQPARVAKMIKENIPLPLPLFMIPLWQNKSWFVQKCRKNFALQIGFFIVGPFKL